MVFSSVIFVTVFLPLFLAVYYLTPLRYRSWPILLGSYLFYGWWRLDFLALLVVVTLFNYALSLAIYRTANTRKWLITGVTGNLLTLGYFKYFNFGVEQFNTLIASLGGTPWAAWEVILPIGISFFIFQAISYLMDVARRDTEPAESLLDFAAFIALFPQLIAGPVLRYKDIAWQFRRRVHGWAVFNEGVICFCAGFCQKVLIADSLAPLADMMFTQTAPTLYESWLGLIAYSLQLFFDFSGYSLMAIGLGLMMGFRFIWNFNHPYISRSITEFWRRWHISLSTWLKDYLYIPLGGNRQGKARTYLNLMLTMVLGGFWHGANLTFLLWGFWHGLWLCVERLLGGKKHSPYPPFLALPITLLVVMLGWVLFRSPDMTTAIEFYAGLAGLNGVVVSDNLAWKITPLLWGMTLIGAALIFISPIYTRFKSAEIGGWARSLNRGEQFLLMLLFVIAFCKLVSHSYSPFLYFQF